MRIFKTCLVLFVLVFTAVISQAQEYYDLIGLTLLRDTATNVNGSGIRVGQPEANLVSGAVPSVFEVNPTNQSQPTSLFTYESAQGIAYTYTNAVGTNSSHADGVANGYYGLPDGMATNVAHVDNYDADFYITNYVYNLQRDLGDLVVNQSYSYGYLDASDQENVDSAFDDYEETFHTLFASAADNLGTINNASLTVAAPGTAYNCICVGAYYGNSQYGNSLGPTIDNGRCKPDISGISGDTSYAVNQVSGAAADLMQAALRGDGGSDTNSAFNLRTIKALLLNGAVKPLGWTNSNSSPLDARFGSGVLNVFNSYRQLVGGKHGCIVSQLISSGGTHPPTGSTGTESILNGWDFSTNTSSSNPAKDCVNHYYFDVSNNVAGATFTATATLVWNRHLDKTGINNLSLFLYNCANSNLVNCSTSLVDNVQHLYQASLAQGRYDLQVWKAGGGGIITTNEPYALAFEFSSESLGVTQSGTNTTLTWPTYPAGFVVLAATNLDSTNWSSASLPQPTITNNMNSLQLGSTNPYEFYRLRQPNF